MSGGAVGPARGPVSLRKLLSAAAYVNSKDETRGEGGESGLGNVLGTIKLQTHAWSEAIATVKGYV